MGSSSRLYRYIDRHFRKQAINARIFQSRCIQTTVHREDWNSHEEFFKFTRGRFIFDEEEQLSKRQIQFDMNELAKIAARSVGAKRCTNIEKCADGMFNKAYTFTLDNGKQVIGKVPNPNAGIPHYTTASEVATMDFMRTVLNTPVPEIYTWNSRINDENKVGAEYLVMEKITGIQLGEVWRTMEPTDKVKIFLQVADYQKAWTETKFAGFGSLYYHQDLHESLRQPLTADQGGQTITFEKFALGPATGREWSDDGRDKLSCDRGPWTTIHAYRRAVGLREELAIREGENTPKQLAMLYGPRLYQPTTRKRLGAVDSYEKLLINLLPSDPSLLGGHLWHDDLHCENIFVDPSEPTKVVGIIDWQSTEIAPLFDHCMDPAFIDYHGTPISASLKRPQLPKHMDSFSKPEKRQAIQNHLEKSLMVGWRMIVKHKSPPQFSAAMFDNTIRGYLLLLSRRLYELGEPQFHALSLDLQKEWIQSHPVDKGESFPLSFSEEHESEILADREAAQLSSEVMKSIQHRMGNLWPEKALVEHENYRECKDRLRQIKEELMTEFALTSEERVVFNHLWPFDD